MPADKTKAAKGSRSLSLRNGSPVRAFVWDMLTFDKLMTGAVTHLIYWSGMAIIAVIGFGMVGAAVGLFLRDFSFEGIALAIPLFIIGLLVTAALMLIWRGLCEFYLAVFRIAEDLRALRVAQETQARPVVTPVQDV